MADKSRGAVLQFEIDVDRWNGTLPSYHSESGFKTTSVMDRIYAMAKTAACDTILNGGTFVLVVSATKITMVQRPDAEDV